MRYAVLSDIHGNLEALEAVLAHARAEADAVLCLGDVVGYGADPVACVELVAERAVTTVAGNHEHAVAGLLDLDWFNPYARVAAEWTRERLDGDHVGYLAALPLRAEVADATLVHASPRHPEEWDYLISAADGLVLIFRKASASTIMPGMQYRVAIVPSDSLRTPPAPDVPADSALPLTASPLQVAAAEAALEAARLAVRLQRRSVFSTPTIIGGIETGDPTGSEPGILPTFGLGLPLPLLSRNRGPIAQAEAEQARARAALTLAQVQSHTEIARTRRELAIALSKLQRDRVLVAAANRVAAMSLTAYREGAASLPNVLEAQRNAREVLAQYVDDLADAWIFAAELRVLSLTPTATP